MILNSGSIIDPTWWSTKTVNTAPKGPQPAQGWVKDSKRFESIDPINGAWTVTNSVDLPKNVTSYYLDTATKKRACFNQSLTCSLQIFTYIETKEFKFPRYDVSILSEENKKRQQTYLLNNFKRFHDITMEMQTFTFHYNGSKIRFAVRARGISGEFHNMTLYYYYCNEIVWNGVRLPRTIAPANGSKSVTLNCTSNAVSKDNESSFEGSCWYNGTWSFPGNDTLCSCRPGYEMLEMGCRSCQQNYYKPKDISNKERCKLCPNGSKSNMKNTACVCIREKHRLKNESKVNSAPCYGFPSKVRDIKIERKGFGRTIILKWKRPIDNGGLPDSLKYDVYCAPDCNNQLEFIPNRINLTNTSVRISDLIPGRLYKFTVSSKNIISEHADGSYASESKTHKVPDERNETDEMMLKLEYQLVAGIGTSLIVILAVALIYTLRRKRHKHKNCGIKDNEMTLPDIGQKMFIDPMNYGDAETALKEFANEIDPASLALECIIGGGEFGDVYKGTLTLPDGKTMTVAAKTLKSNASEKSCRDFFLEASAMGQFDDPNVIHLQGIISKVVAKMIVTEFMLNGSLDHFLKKNDGGFTAIQLFSMARGVASGMKYLATINFVHRDLAARNVLVDDDMTCKIADFGLSREVETTESSQGEYLTQGGKIPVRWTAPEAIKFRIFSTASDVWSFGILLWELMTSAQRPYWDWDNFKVMERVEDGFRLPCPVNCPQAVHELMLKCWDKDRSLRPHFSDILVIIDEWIESPESLPQSTMRDRSKQVPYTGSTTTVQDWLQEIKMSSYMPHFAAAGYERLSDLVGLLDNDLKELGISLVGHRNKMLRTIRSLPIAQE